MSRFIEKAFNELGVPYKLVGGVSFFERREIKDLTSYLTCAVNPMDDIGFERILNAPKRGIGKMSIQKIRDIDMPGASLLQKAPVAIQKKLGLKKAAARNLPIASISSDSWGVDYVLLDDRGLVMPPVPAQPRSDGARNRRGSLRRRRRPSQAPRAC